VSFRLGDLKVFDSLRGDDDPPDRIWTKGSGSVGNLLWGIGDCLSLLYLISKSFPLFHF